MRGTVSSQALDRAIVVTNAPISSTSALSEEDEQEFFARHMSSHDLETPAKLQA